MACPAGAPPIPKTFAVRKFAVYRKQKQGTLSVRKRRLTSVHFEDHEDVCRSEFAVRERQIKQFWCFFFFLHGER